eukprot:CAMPEP_0172819070 /NCGR_PEP_ID=MMETSP1075-20121228/14336_1 /TAXON_ID=2916 /ORGANISM="Ceratium fusus, Strain PA161109" /LENGTH=55 /DNA_ID=CAMNT_0013659527 /DNA_START=386 /DNA_END=553 /DNA_ORIENTATION=+
MAAAAAVRTPAKQISTVLGATRGETLAAPLAFREDVPVAVGPTGSMARTLLLRMA